MPEPININLEWLLRNFSVWGYGHPDENELSEDPLDPLGSEDHEKYPLSWSEDHEKETDPDPDSRERDGDFECGS